MPPPSVVSNDLVLISYEIYIWYDDFYFEVLVQGTHTRTHAPSREQYSANNGRPMSRGGVIVDVRSKKGFVMRSWLRFRLSTLLVATAIIAIATYHINWRYFTPDGVYQTTKNGHALLGILGVEIRNGDTLSAVRRHLGNGFVVTDKQHLAKIQSNLEANKTFATDGYRDTDTFLTYSSTEGIAVELQFRNQILINFYIPEAARPALISHYKTCTQFSKRNTSISTGPKPTQSPAAVAR